MRNLCRLVSTVIAIAILTGCTNAIEGTPLPVDSPTSPELPTGIPLADNTSIPSIIPTNIEYPTIEPPTLTPEAVKTFNVCRNRSEAMSCPVSQDDLDSGAFLDFVKKIDNTTFPADVVFPPKLTLLGPPPPYGKTVFWRDLDGSDERLTAFYLTHPDKLNQRTVAYGSIDLWGVKVVKVLNPSGRVSYLMYYTQIDGLAADNVSTWPWVTGDNGKVVYSDPTIEPLLMQWIETGEVPIELEGKMLWEFTQGGH